MNCVFFCSNALNPGSGVEIPVKWHGTGACHGHINPKLLVLKARLFALSLYPEHGYVIETLWYFITTPPFCIRSITALENVSYSYCMETIDIFS